jgi:hypothetical protein
MKNRTSNGAANRTAEITTTRRTELESILEKDRQEREAEFAANEARFNARTKQLTVEIGLHEYGLLCAGAVHHETTVEELLAAWLNVCISEWANNSFLLRD